MALLTSRGLAQSSAITPTTLIHIVTTADTSQSIYGSSYKAELQQLTDIFSGNTFTGGSGNCITDFYVTNIHGCSPISIWDETQTNGSNAYGILSFSLGIGSKTYGNYSHANGSSTQTGSNLGYLLTGCTAGVCTLDSSYGDVSTNFTTGSTSFIFFDDTDYSSVYVSQVFSVSAVTFDGTYTIVYLDDITVDTLGTPAIISDTNAPPFWGGDQVFGGDYANATGVRTQAIGFGSFTQGTGSYSLGEYSFAKNYSSAIGPYSSSEGKTTYSYGIASHAEGQSTMAIGVSSHAEGASTIASGIFSHAEGDSSIASGQYSHSQNKGSQAVGGSSHAGGFGGKAIGEVSFAHGVLNEAGGIRSVSLGGDTNIITTGNTQDSVIIGGSGNTITYIAPTDEVTSSAIIGGSGNTVNSFESVLVGGHYNTVSGPRSVVLGGTGINATGTDTAYVPNFVITTSYTPTGTADSAGEPGSITWDDNNLYYKTNTGWYKLTGSAF